jgi:ATP-dependent RNA helicase DeaD
VEQEQESTGIARSQNQLHVLTEDSYEAAAAIGPLLDRLDPETPAAQLVIITADVEAAASLASRLAPAAEAKRLRLVAATEARRTARVLRSGTAHVMIGPPSGLLWLLQASALKLDQTRAVVLAWVDDLVRGATAALETLMTEVPKDSARIVLVSAYTPAVEQLVERYARRARRVTPTAEAPPPISLSYVTTSEHGRIHGLRRTLDLLDPESAFIVARHPESLTQVGALLRSLGYAESNEALRVGEAPDANARLIILYDVPTSEEGLRRIAGGGGGSARVVALVTPRQIASLRRLAGGAVAPLALPEAAARARSREEGLRDELRAVLEGGQYSRELLTLEPLLADYDAAEVAGAALRLLDTERSRPQAATGTPAMTRLYLSVGTTDGARAGDLVGAITNEAGISKADVGKVDVRDRHSTVEVATAVANSVVEKMTGTQIRGRRILARIDADRPREGGGPRDRPPRRDGERPRRDAGPSRGPRPNRERPPRRGG